ncbi:hypothetical protein KEM55_004615 [Ascosphaera atra]|nr:hypothetical protein KEM55_004615 [Ascosphaera atra]
MAGAGIILQYPSSASVAAATGGGPVSRPSRNEETSTTAFTKARPANGTAFGGANAIANGSIFANGNSTGTTNAAATQPLSASMNNASRSPPTDGAGFAATSGTGAATNSPNAKKRRKVNHGEFAVQKSYKMEA